MLCALQSALLGLSESAAILKLFYRLSFGVLCSGVECFNFRGLGLGERGVEWTFVVV